MAPRYRRRPSVPAVRLDGDEGIDSARLQILLEDYAQCRDDERTWVIALASLIAVAFTLVGLLAAAVTQTCRFSTSRSCTNVPDYVVGAAPLLPVALIGFLQSLGIIATIRNYYMRALEEEIRRYAGGPLKAISPVTGASYIDIIAEFVSMRRGNWAYRVLMNLIVVIVLITFGGFACYIAVHMDPRTQAMMTVIYLPIVLLLAYENYLGGIGGRTMFSTIAQRYLAHRYSDGYALHGLVTDAPGDSRAERPLLSYLLLPRVAEWVKWAIAPGAFIVTAWTTGDLRNWHRFILVWLILEFLIYEARYQWNDIRGVGEDPKHALSTARMRLPVQHNVQRNIIVSCVTGLARLAIALWIAEAAHLLTAVMLLIGLVFGTAIIYETLRTAPESMDPLPRPTARSYAIWITVGIGYAIRSGTGIWLGGYPVLSLTAISGMAYFAAFGIMLVLLVWVLDAASSYTTDGSELLFAEPESTRKVHVSSLLRWAGWTVQVGMGDLQGAVIPVLKVKQGKLYAPWNVAMLLSAGLAAIVGARLTRSEPLSEYGPIIAVSIIGALSLVMLHNFAARLAVTTTAAIALIGVAFSSARGPLAIVSAVPWVAVAAGYAFFRESTYQELMGFVPSLASGLRTMFRTLPVVALRLVIGRQAWYSAGFTEPSGNPGTLPDNHQVLRRHAGEDGKSEQAANSPLFRKHLMPPAPAKRSACRHAERQLCARLEAASHFDPA
jgi:hypothetical protein